MLSCYAGLRVTRRARIAAGMLVSYALLLAQPVVAQISAGGTPLSFTASVPGIAPTVQMPPVDVAAYIAEDEQAPKDTPYRFGVPIDVHLTLENSGTWTVLPDGGRVWRLRIASSDAYSINLIYDRWYIPDGAELFLYNDDRSQVIGAFTSANNWTDGTNLTAPTAGDAVTLEYIEPERVWGQGALSISRVVHAYRNVFGRRSLDDFGDSGWCNTNVNCSIGEPWQSEKRGVALIMDSGWRICTGCLVNNTDGDFTPYFLTANHCIEGGIGGWVFVFNYESPTCANVNGPLNQTVSNATLRANNAASDFALLQLSSSVPLTYNPFFCGWSAVDTPATNSVCIHHPNGDIKKISFDYDPPLHGTWSGTPARSHWHIARWDSGTTEPGSSGSPLFDQNHRITGQLHGGQANCNNNVNDYFGKFSLSWNTGSTAATRLRDWLDPDNTGVLMLDGADPNMTGRVAGTVNSSGGSPLADVRVHAMSSARETTTNAQGTYVLPLPEGTWSIEFTKFGYNRVQVDGVQVLEGDTAWVNPTLNTVPGGVLAGTVTTQYGAALEGARVVIQGTPIDTLETDSLGRFVTDLPATSYMIHAALTVNFPTPIEITEDTVIMVNAGDTTDVQVQISTAMADPTNADAYGYRAYDRLDRDLPAVYEWSELDPAFGGTGEEFAYSHHDSAVFLPAPFPFTFYNTAYDTLTVNCNGWVLPGVHHDAGSINTMIPSNTIADPPGIIAAFWDDMRTGLGAQQFAAYDVTDGSWILEFVYQHLVAPNTYLHSWQVHVLDPAIHPSLSGDCDVVVMYKQMGYPQSCTVGIERPDELTGVQVLFSSSYNSTSWPIAEEAAIRFTTGRSTETGTIAGTLALYPPSENVTSAVVHVGGLALSPNSSGQFTSSSVPTRRVSALLNLDGYEAGRATYVPIGDDSVTNLTLEAWRLDPPLDLSASQYNRVITLRWRTPESVQYHANPDIKYEVVRDGDVVFASQTDTVLVDNTVPEEADSVSYTVRALYRYGESAASQARVIVIDLAAEEANAGLPTAFALHPCYPNPFNPATTLRYDLPRAAEISLRIYNLSGQRVATLVSGEQSAGVHHVAWQADEHSSGMYLAVLEAGEHVFAQKLLLLK